MTMSDVTREFNYHAFLCYSKINVRVAKALHRELESLIGFSWKREIKIFRDETDLDASPALLNQLLEHVDQSRHMIVLVSVEMPASKWMPIEIEHFLKSHAKDDIIPVSMSGSLDLVRQISKDHADFSTDEVQKAAPLVLQIPESALHRRERGLRRALTPIAAQIAARLLNRPLREIYGHQLARQRVYGIVGIAIIMALTALSILAIVQYREAQRNLELAERRLELGVHVAERVVHEIDRELERRPGNLGVRAILVQEANDLLTALEPDHGHDRDAILALGAIYQKEGNMAYGAGDLDLAEQSYRRSMESYSSVFPICFAGIIESRVQLAAVYQRRGDWASVRGEVLAASELVPVGFHHGDPAESERLEYAYVGSMRLMAWVLDHHGDRVGAEQAMDTAVNAARLTWSRNPQNSDALESLVFSLIDLAEILDVEAAMHPDVERYNRRIAALAEVESLTEDLSKIDPHAVDYMFALASAAHQLGRHHEATDRIREAYGKYQREAELLRGLAAEGANDITVLCALAESEKHLGRVATRLHGPEKALEHFNRGSDLLQEAATRSPNDVLIDLPLAEIFRHIGDTRLSLDDAAGAEAAHVAGLRVLAGHVPFADENPEILAMSGDMQMQLGFITLAAGNELMSEFWFELALDDLRALEVLDSTLVAAHDIAFLTGLARDDWGEIEALDPLNPLTPTRINDDLNSLYPDDSRGGLQDVVDLAVVGDVVAVAFNPSVREIPNVVFYVCESGVCTLAREGLSLGLEIQKTGSSDLHVSAEAFDVVTDSVVGIGDPVDFFIAQGFTVSDYGDFLHVHLSGDREMRIDKRAHLRLRDTFFGDLSAADPTGATGQCLYFDQPRLVSMDSTLSKGRYELIASTDNGQRWAASFADFDESMNLVDLRVDAKAAAAESVRDSEE